jgi:hypothetical protein
MRAFWRSATDGASLGGDYDRRMKHVERALVVPPGEGHQVGNVEFLARSLDTPRFQPRGDHDAAAP